MTQAKPTVWRSVRRWLPGVVISLVARIVLFQLSNWADISLAFTALRPINLGIALVLDDLSLGTRAMGWVVLLEHKTTFSKAFFTVNLGYLLNNIFPLRAGEIGRALFMGRSTGISPLHVLVDDRDRTGV
jgi:glycosyltransferase 2 family protein